MNFFCTVNYKFTLNEAFDKARAAAMPEIPPPITITEGGEEFCPSMCLKKPDRNMNQIQSMRTIIFLETLHIKVNKTLKLKLVSHVSHPST